MRNIKIGNETIKMKNQCTYFKIPLFILTLCLFSLVVKSQTITKRKCYKVYVTGIKSETKALELADEFKKQPGVYKATYIFKSADHKYTLLEIYTEVTEPLKPKEQTKDIKVLSFGDIKTLLMKNDLGVDNIIDNPILE